MFERRLRSNGSRYNDGLVGWKKLAQRNQNTITGWKFSEDGRELLSVEQSVANLSSSVKLALSKVLVVQLKSLKVNSCFSLATVPMKIQKVEVS